MPPPYQRRFGFTESQLFVATLAVPLAAYDLSLQGARLSAHLSALIEPGVSPLRTGLLLMASAAAFDLGFILFCSILMIVRDQSSVRWYCVAIFLQLLALVIGASDTAAYFYFMQTVDALDWPLLLHIFRAPQDLAIIMAGEVTPAQWLLLGLVVLLVAVGPWVVRRWVRRSKAPIYFGRERRSLALARIALALAVPVTLLGLLPPLGLSKVAVVRSPVLHVLVTALRPTQIDPVLDQALAGVQFFEPGKLAIERIPEADPVQHNLVVIVLESTRARSTTVYSPDLPTTPFLASIAEQGLVVDKAYVVIPATAKALTAIFCSIYPSLTLEPRALTEGLLGRCLPQLLREQGYSTMFAQTASPRFENRLRAVPNMGFETFIKAGDLPNAGFEEPNFLGYEDDVMLQPNASWLLAHKDKPFMAAYLTVNAHHDYKRLTRHGIYHFAPDDDAYDRYLNNIRHDDYFLEQLFDQYKKAGVYEKTLFVIVGDHGEGFGEHGRLAHNTVPYEEGTRVPMIFFDPSGKLVKPGHINGPVSELDILPTVLPLLGFRIARGKVHGLSIFDSPRDRVLMLSCFGACAARVTDTEAFIHHFGRREDELYDLRSDPYEKEDIAGRFPQLAQKRREELVQFQQRVSEFFYLHRLHAR